MNKSFFTIGIGASAGGMPALIEFFEHLSPTIDVAVVVVMHLLRERRSILDRLLSKYTSVPVIRVEEDTRLLPKHIYVLAENTTLTIQDGWLRVKPRDLQILNDAIDLLFASLAIDFGKKSIGVIFSGGGSDGLQGALKIREEGGIVLVQDPESAQVNGMPYTIISHDHPNAVLKPAALAEHLNDWCVLRQNQ